MSLSIGWLSSSVCTLKFLLGLNYTESGCQIQVNKADLDTKTFVVIALE